MEKLQGYDFQIMYKLGKYNVVADSLSRQGSTTLSLLLTISSPSQPSSKNYNNSSPQVKDTN